MAPGVDAGDTAWMLAATALVLLMTPALGLFYAGLVRSKNTLNTFMMCVAALAVATITWALIGYSFAFAPGNGFIGGFGHAFLHDVGFAPREGTTIPHLLFFAFQATFCIVTTALVAGAVVERMRFGPFLVFAALWSVLVYGVLAHWAFGGGWLQAQGTLDFAGGVPVEMGSGLLRAGRRAGGGRAARLRAPGVPPAQLDVRAARRRAAVVRVVRLQRRLRVQRRQRGRARVRQHAADPGLRAGDLVRARPAALAAGDRDRRGDGDRRRLRRASRPRRASSRRCGRWCSASSRRCPATR